VFDSLSAFAGEEGGSQGLVRVKKWSAGADQTDHGLRDRRTVLSVWEIPPPALAGSITACGRRYAVEQPGGVLIKIAPVILENHPNVLMASEREIEEWSGAVERLGQHQVEGARIGGDHALQ